MKIGKISDCCKANIELIRESINKNGNKITSYYKCKKCEKLCHYKWKNTKTGKIYDEHPDK